MDTISNMFQGAPNQLSTSAGPSNGRGTLGMNNNHASTGTDSSNNARASNKDEGNESDDSQDKYVGRETAH